MKNKLILNNFFYSLQVVSTKVGGVPEVLPPDLIYLAEPNDQSKYSEICLNRTLNKPESCI